jgi:hypothetical protein
MMLILFFLYSKGGLLHVFRQGFSRHNRISVSNDGKKKRNNEIQAIHILIISFTRYNIHDVYK